MGKALGGHSGGYLRQRERKIVGHAKDSAPDPILFSNTWHLQIVGASIKVLNYWLLQTATAWISWRRTRIFSKKQWTASSFDIDSGERSPT